MCDTKPHMKNANQNTKSKRSSETRITLKRGWEYDKNGQPVRTKDKKRLTKKPLSFAQGGPCPNCGNVHDRWKDGSCAPCRRERARDVYAKRKLSPDKYEAWKERSRANARQRKELELQEIEKTRPEYLMDATPPWLTIEQIADIEAMYFKARYLTKRTGVPHVVDHIIPLKHPEVCGLHVPWNLQVITAKANAAKKDAHFEDPNNL